MAITALCCKTDFVSLEEQGALSYGGRLLGLISETEKNNGSLYVY